MVCFVILFLLSGCGNKYDYDIDTVVYNLNIGKSFKENIIFTYSKDIYDIVKKEENDLESTSVSVEYTLLKDKLEPINSVHNIYYDKRIINNGNKVNIELKYDFLEVEYDELLSDENYFEVTLSGEFLCYNNKNVEINVTSDYIVDSTNGEKIDREYMWFINENNYKNVNIHHKVLRDFNNQLKKHNLDYNYNGLNFVIMIILVIIVMYSLYKVYRMKKISSDI